MFLIAKIKGYINKKKWEFYRTAPKQRVLELNNSLFVDGKEIKYVLKDSVKTESLGVDQTVITISFVASDYLKIS